MKRLTTTIAAGLLALCTTAFAQKPMTQAEITEATKWLNMFGTGGGGEWASITIDEVQAELKLTPDQRKRFDTMEADFREAMLQGIQDTRRAAENGDEIKRRFRAKVDQVLNAHQAARFKEINIQLMGYFAALVPDVQKAMGLSAKEIGDLKSVYMRHHTAIWESYGSIMGAPADRIAAVVSGPQKALDADLAKALSEKQKATLKQLGGAPMKLPPSTPIYRAMRHYRIPTGEQR